MRKQILIPFFILIFLGILVAGCGSGKGGAHRDSPSSESDGEGNQNLSTPDTIDSEEAGKIKDAVMAETLLNINSLFEIPTDKGWSRSGMEDTITFSKESYGEVSSEGSVKASLSRSVSGTVEIDTDNNDSFDISKSVNISMTTTVEAKADSEGGWQIVATSPTEIITIGANGEQPDFSIKWVKIMDGENWEVHSSGTIFKIPDEIPSFAPGSEITVEVAIVTSVGVKVYLYHHGNMDPMKYDRTSEEGYSIYSKNYTAGPKKGEYVGAVEVISEESLSDTEAAFQSMAWLIGYIVQ